MKQPMQKTIHCGISVNGEVHALAQLSAKFQIKARDYGLNDSESLAVWIEGNHLQVQTYFGSRKNEYRTALENGKTKLLNAPKTWNL
ncbi:MAG TPA: hypothetical protein PLC89_12620 [Haliscomenobacter sp.]|uniref:hypothetical protein n=1 Tax=Haliscomenobacter sp. TaxID=2717303 RepID=UPI002C2F7B3E|nr:hypothetical protein [Haliscomenobacter sp.]HOY18140.1 hypothetical protein [Haliscomenobacter sp.]